MSTFSKMASVQPVSPEIYGGFGDQLFYMSDY